MNLFGDWVHSSLDHYQTYIKFDNDFVIILKQDNDGRFYSSRYSLTKISPTAVELRNTHEKNYSKRWDFLLIDDSHSRLIEGDKIFDLRRLFTSPPPLQKAFQEALRIASNEFFDS